LGERVGSDHGRLGGELIFMDELKLLPRPSPIVVGEDLVRGFIIEYWRGHDRWVTTVEAHSVEQARAIFSRDNPQAQIVDCY
jgi:hypothetical protein